MQLHHIGCLTNDIEKSIRHYKLLHTEVSASTIYNIENQQVKVCFVNLSDEGKATKIELVQPLNEASFLYKLMTKKGVNFYHLGFYTEDIDAKTEELKEQGFHLVNSFQSEAFEMRKCVFLYSPDMHLIELIEK